jgi:hypothetical protein
VTRKETLMVRVTSLAPEDLLRGIRAAIEDGTIQTWESTSKGYFTHTASSGQWKNKAWLKPTTDEKGVTFNISRPKDGRVSKEVYAIYHGRFAEMLLAHFDTEIGFVRLTALAGDGDLV